MNFTGVVSSAKKALGFPVEQKSASLLDEAVFPILGATPSSSGARVTGTAAMYVPAVLQAIRLISETIGSLPCKLYRETEDGNEAEKEHPANRLVHNLANGWTSAGELRVQLTVDALLHNGGYAEVVRSDDGRPLALHRIYPWNVQRRLDLYTGEPFYIVSTDRGQVQLPYSEVLYVPAFNGVSPIKLGREAIGLASVLERHGSQFFANGTRPSVIITNDKAQGNEAGARSVANIRASYEEWSKKGGPLIMDGGWTPHYPTMTSTDAQFIENRLEQINEIARIFGVPPTMLFQLDRGTWSNAEQMAASFLTLCLRPWLDRWQDAYSIVLLTEEEQDQLYFEFDTADLERADAAGRAEIYSKSIASRWMTPNEVRARENLPPIAGGDELANPFTTSNTTGPADRQQPKEAA